MSEAAHTLYQGRWLRLMRQGSWEYCERHHGGGGMAVVILATTPDDRVLLVEQYRVPVGARCIEMPAGLVGDTDASDTLTTAAARELVEETGWQAAHLEVLVSGPSSPGFGSERLALVYASGLRQVGSGGGVAGEAITVHAVPRRDVPAWLLQKQAEGCALDLKLWSGLWFLEHHPDGRRRGLPPD